MGAHGNIPETTASRLHPPFVVSESDPGAIGAGKAWFKRSTLDLKVRNAADSGWDTVATGGGVSDGDKGDVTVSSSGTTWTIDNDAVTYAKMQNVSAESKLIGRGQGSGSGDAQEITLGTGLSMSGTTLSSSGGAPTDAQYVALATNSTLTNERVLTAGTGVSIVDGGAGSTVTISATGTTDPLFYTRHTFWDRAVIATISYVQSTPAVISWSGAGSSTSADDSDGPWIKNTTAASTGDVAARSGDNHIVPRNWTPVYAARHKTGASVADVRWWLGLFSGSPSASATPAVHMSAFRYDTAADGTAFWRCVTSEATTLTTTATSVAVTANTAYRFRIEEGASSVLFYIDGNLVATHTTNLPTASTGKAPKTTLTTLANAAKEMLYGIQYMYFA